MDGAEIFVGIDVFKNILPLWPQTTIWLPNRVQELSKAQNHHCEEYRAPVHDGFPELDQKVQHGSYSAAASGHGVRHAYPYR